MSEPAPSPAAPDPKPAPDSAPGPISLLQTDQRRRWRRGERVLVEAYVAQQRALHGDAEGLLDLIYNEIVLREERQETPRLEEYVERFPQLAPQLQLQFQVHEAIHAEPATGAAAEQGPGLDACDTLVTAHVPVRPALPGYEFLGELGRGGMGVVFKARQVRVNRLVALKLILAGAHAGERERARFRTEAEAVARLQHPNIVQIHEVGEHGGQPFFSLEFVEGGTLTEKLRDGPLPAAAAAQLVEILAGAVHYAHERGVLHRDLKPSNILLTVAGVPKLSDFGLAKRLDNASAQTSTGAMVGTPSYMAPEQAMSGAGKVGPPTDVYALGAVLYEALTGRPPHRAATVLETLAQVCFAEPAPPRRLQPGVPRDLETICLKCLHKEPARRYATAQALADDLQRFREGRPISARPVGAWGVMVRSCRRKPLVASLLAGIGLLLVVIVVGAPLVAYRLHHAREQALHEKWEAYREAAAARRASQQSGQRFVSLEKLAEAARGRPSLELRNEAIACLALADLQVLRGWEGNPLADGTVAFDPKLQRYAFVDAKGSVQVRQVADDRDVCRLPIADAFHQPRFSPDGRFLVCNHVFKGRLHWFLWDLSRGEPVYKALIGGDFYGAFDFSPDGSWWAGALPNGALELVEPATGRRARRLTPVSGLKLVAFSPDGLRIALYSEATRQVEVRTLATDQAVARLSPPARVASMAWSPDGQSLATGCEDARSYLWDVSTGRQRSVLAGHRSSVIFVAFHPGGDLMVSASWDDTTRLWDARTGRPLVSAAGVALGLNPEGTQLAFREGAQVGLWRMSDGQECQALHHDPSAPVAGPTDYAGLRGVDFSPDGRWLASSGHDGVRLWHLSPQKEIAHLANGPTETVRFHPDGRSLFTIGRVGLHRWALEPDLAEADRYRIGPPEVVRARTPSWSGRRDFDWDLGARTLVASADRTRNQAVLVSLERLREPVLVEDLPGIASVAMSPDGRWAAVGSQRAFGVKVLDAATGAVVKELPTGAERDNGATVAFSPDGRWLVTGGQRDYRFWEVGSWRQVREVKRSRSIETNLGQMAFTPDGRILAVAWSTQAVRLLDPATGAELATLTAADSWPIMRICFSRDGSRLAVATSNDVVQLWDLRQIRGQLAAINLDWDQPPYPPRPASEPAAAPLPMRVVPGEAEVAPKP